LIPESTTYGELLAPIVAGRTSSVSWLRPTQIEYLRAIENLPLATSLHEDWRYLDLAGLGKWPSTIMTPTPPVSIDKLSTKSDLNVELRGGHCTGLPETCPDGVQIIPVSRADPESRQHILKSLPEYDTLSVTNPLALLNMAAGADGLLIRIAPGTCLKQAIRIRCTSSLQTSASFHYLFVELGENAHGCLVEQELGNGRQWENFHTHIHLATNAGLDHLRLQTNAGDGWHMHGLQTQLAAGSNYRLQQFSTGSRLRRNDMRIVLQDRGACATIEGAHIAAQRQQVANLLSVRHTGAGATSKVLFKGAANDRSKALFSGRIRIDEGAGETCAQMQSANLLLANQAEVNTKPVLEIYADDVNCSHGATVGQPDPDQLFYLCSRGIPEPVAHEMLVLSFFNDLITQLQHGHDEDSVRSRFAQRTHSA